MKVIITIVSFFIFSNLLIENQEKIKICIDNKEYQTKDSVFTDTVLICKSVYAYSYHKQDTICEGIAKCTHEIVRLDKKEAEKRGYKPCGYCYRKIKY